MAPKNLPLIINLTHPRLLFYLRRDLAEKASHSTSRVPGPPKKIGEFSNLLSQTAPRNGLLSLSIWTAELESNVVNVGTITWTPESKRSTGTRRKSGFCSWCIGLSITNGLRSPKSSKVAQTTPSKITGIQAWRENCQIWRELFRPILTEQLQSDMLKTSKRPQDPRLMELATLLQVVKAINSKREPKILHLLSLLFPTSSWQKTKRRWFVLALSSNLSATILPR